MPPITSDLYNFQKESSLHSFNTNDNYSAKFKDFDKWELKRRQYGKTPGPNCLTYNGLCRDATHVSANIVCSDTNNEKDIQVDSTIVDCAPETRWERHSCNKSDKESKRKRIKRIISRRLRRSKSDCSVKGTPVHALFLESDVHKCEETIETRAKDLSSLCKRLLNDNGTSTLHKEEFRFHKSYSVDSPKMLLDHGKQPKPKTANCILKGLKKRFSFLRRRNTDTSLISDIHLSMELPAPTYKEVYQWSCSFDSLLHDKNGLEIFQNFLKSEFSEDNLEFWIACEEYELCSEKNRKELAQKICEDYLVSQAPKEMSLDYNTKSTTLNKLDLECPTDKMFAHAKRRIQILMERDSYARFIESDLYLHLLKSLEKVQRSDKDVSK